MRRLFAAMALAFVLTTPLVGCAQLQKTYEVVTSAKVSPTAVVVAVNAFNALEATATNYLLLPRCVTGGPVICRQSAATQPIKRAVLSGRAARNKLTQFYAEHPGELGPKGLYDALVAATDTLQAIYATYGVK